MQLAVDLEVLRVIARTRMEIKAIRSKYTAMKAEREYLPPGIYTSRHIAPTLYNTHHALDTSQEVNSMHQV